MSDVSRMNAIDATVRSAAERLPASSATTGLRAGASQEEIRGQLQKKAVEFEAVFITQMLKPMFEGTQAEEPFGGGMAEDVWRSFEMEEYGKAIAQSGGIGLADAVYRQLLAVQERKGS